MDERSLRAVAGLHAACLPDSLIGALGSRYLGSFYHYVTRSEHEVLFVEPDEQGQPVAAAVLSMNPASLPRRLLLSTPLLPCAALRLGRLAATARKSMHSTRGAPPVADPVARAVERPQLILIFTAAEQRGRGRGSALIRKLERYLERNGVAQYEVRTESDPSNRARAFYRRLGFELDGFAVRFGTRFEVLVRSLTTDRPAQRFTRHSP